MTKQAKKPTESEILQLQQVLLSIRGINKVEIRCKDCPNDVWAVVCLVTVTVDTSLTTADIYEAIRKANPDGILPTQILMISESLGSSVLMSRTRHAA